MQNTAKWTRADQSVHAESYHSICRSYTPDGKQDTCIRKFSKLSIILTSPAVLYALAAVKIEPMRFLQVTRWFCGGIAAGLRWVKSPSGGGLSGGLRKSAVGIKIAPTAGDF